MQNMERWSKQSVLHIERFFSSQDLCISICLSLCQLFLSLFLKVSLTYPERDYMPDDLPTYEGQDS